MPAASFPVNEPDRLADLLSFQILDTEREEIFDRFTRLASALLDTPAAAISFVDKDRQWFKSRVGLTAQETPRQNSFCGYTILGTEPLVIEDMQLDERVSDNELVTGDPCIRFYAGAPLRTRDGHNIGALCAIDTRPRSITRTQMAGLTNLAQAVMKVLEAKSAAHRMAAHYAVAAEPALNDVFPRADAKLLVKVNPADLHVAVEAMSQGVCMFDARGQLILCNSRYAELYRLPPSLAQPGTSLREIVDARYAKGSCPNLTLAEFLEWREQRAGLSNLSETEVELRDGRIIAVRHHPMSDGGYLATHDDITMRRMAEARVIHMARHDGLTDLPNRAFFNERLSQAIARAARGTSFAILCLDLDGFKQVNDTFGHGVGDKLLIAVGQRISTCIRSEVDLLARLGGDEFAIIQDSIESETEITATCERIIAAISHPFSIDGYRVSVGVSIGVTVGPEDGMDAETLLHNGDLALYLAKSEGKGVFRFFEPEIDARAQLRRSLEVDLREAIRNDELEVHYQPLVNLVSQQVCGVEALVRWNHPVRGMTPPQDFIPLAEEAGLISSIGEFVLRRACMDSASWPDSVMVAVNISPVQFRHTDLFELVRDALEQSGLRPGRLEIEITESVLMTRDGPALETLKRLRSLGVRIALDDFGTGYSSLSYLNSFPFDKIKIDQSFVRHHSHRRDLACIIEAVVGMAGGLGMSTTAEGVETLEEFESLVREGCTEAQGFLFSPARPAKDIPSLLRHINEGAL